MRRAPGGGGTMNTASADVRGNRRGGGAAFLAVTALLFAGAVTATVHGCRSMSMPWMRMPDQTWPGVLADFLGMWIPMMAAMMLPSAR